MHDIVDVATLIVIVAGITVMVRPGSQGPTLVNSITSGFANSIKAATSFSN
jgi:hypothetical protein